MHIGWLWFIISHVHKMLFMCDEPLVSEERSSKDGGTVHLPVLKWAICWAVWLYLIGWHDASGQGFEFASFPNQLLCPLRSSFGGQYIDVTEEITHDFYCAETFLQVTEGEFRLGQGEQQVMHINVVAIQKDDPVHKPNIILS